MAGTITGSSAVYMITIPLLYPTPVQLQGFAADDVFDTDQIDSAEVSMGVDGEMSGGFVFVPIPQNVKLQADSDSIDIFDNWWGAMQQSQEIIACNGLVSLPTIGKKWTMTRGFLTGYKPLPDTKKLLQPQSFRITWNRVLPAPI